MVGSIKPKQSRQLHRWNVARAPNPAGFWSFFRCFWGFFPKDHGDKTVVKILGMPAFAKAGTRNCLAFPRQREDTPNPGKSCTNQEKVAGAILRRLPLFRSNRRTTNLRRTDRSPPSACRGCRSPASGSSGRSPCARGRGCGPIRAPKPLANPCGSSRPGCRAC